MKKQYFIRICVSTLLFAAATILFGAEPLEIVPPEQLGFDSGLTKKIDSIVGEMLEQNKTCGLVVAVGCGDKIAYLKAFGNRQVKPAPEPMKTDTLFDMASITKPVATATAMAILYDEKKYSLDDPVAKYLPEFGENQKSEITIRDCLIHASGLRDSCIDQKTTHDRSDVWKAICQSTPVSKRGEEYKYQCSNFITLCFLAERLSGKSLKEFTEERIFAPLEMDDTMFVPDEERKKRSSTTEFVDGRWLQGVVHDPNARTMDGISGNAGLFSTAPDLAVFSAMILNGGALQRNGKEVRIISKDTLALWTADYAIHGDLRGLGWDKRSSHSSNRSSLYTEKAFGHGGFTGTSLWIDPGHHLFVIVLGNRLHPEFRDNLINRQAARIGTAVVESIR